MTAFMRTIEDAYAVPAFDYRALHDFSLANPDAFWRSVWTFTGIRGDIGEHVVADYDRMPGAHFFPEARLNFAENLLRRRSAPCGRRARRTSASTASSIGSARSSRRSWLRPTATSTRERRTTPS